MTFVNALLLAVLGPAYLLVLSSRRRLRVRATARAAKPGRRSLR